MKIFMGCRLKSLITGLFSRYRSHHDMNRSFLEWVGAVGLIAFPLFYLLRFTGNFPSRYDDLELRLVATSLCLFLALRKWWPFVLKPFYIAYSYLVVFYCLSFMMSFTALKNEGEIFSIVNMMVGAFLTILLADWRNAIAMLVLGYGLSLAAFDVSQPVANIPGTFFVWMPACVLVVVAGALSHFAQKQAELSRMRLLYASLAGSIAHEMRAPLQKVLNVFDTLERDFIHVDGSHASVSFTRGQLVDMACRLKEGRDAIKLGMQSITVTLQQLKSKAFDEASFTCLSAAACTRRAVNEFSYESPEQRERVRVKEVADFTFKGDETILVLVLFNLIKNALYYLPAYPGAKVTVMVDGQRITVRDTGPGIAPGRLANLFEDFQTSGKAEGTGLGLAFCRRAMRAFGGEISCTSRLGEFTQFTLSFPELPLAEVTEHLEETMRSARRLLRGRRVLVVDDEAFQRSGSRAKLLELGGEAIDEACNGAQALEMLRFALLEPYDLVVMDINMPVLDGYEAARQIRLGTAPGHEHVPLLAHSANPLPEARVKAREAGMDEFLSKPCKTSDMARMVVRLLKDQPVRDRAEMPKRFAGRSVMLADDSSVNRAIVRSYLEELGMEVMEAKQGLDVLRLLRAGAQPAVILMDLEMPVLDGMETTRQLRSMDGVPSNMPVIALTGHSSREDRDAALAAGMDGFISKPVSVRALSEELARVLGASRSRAASPVSSAPSEAVADGSLLDLERIEQFKRMGAMVRLLPEGLAELRRLVGALEEAVRRTDFRGARQALHSLVGVSGEMGARALFEVATVHIHAVEKHTWPTQADWLDELKALSVESERALRACYAISGAPTS